MSKEKIKVWQLGEMFRRLENDWRLDASRGDSSYLDDWIDYADRRIDVLRITMGEILERLEELEKKGKDA
jgi:hypothetical protein